MRHGATEIEPADHRVNEPDGWLVWKFGETRVDVERLLRDSPDLKSRACTSYLLHYERAEPLPKAHIRSDSALTNIRAMLPGLDFRIESPRAFGRIFRQRTQRDDSDECDSLLSVPHAHDDQWRLMMRSEDDEAQFVLAPLLLEMVGQYALFRAAGIERTPNLDVTLISGFEEVQAMLETAGVPTCEHQVIQGASWVAGYVLAHLLGLDQRLVTFGLLSAADASAGMDVLFRRLTFARGDVLAFEQPMRAFLRQRTSVTREGWMAADPKSRLRMISEAAGALITDDAARTARQPARSASGQNATAGHPRTLH